LIRTTEAVRHSLAQREKNAQRGAQAEEVFDQPEEWLDERTDAPGPDMGRRK